MKKRVLSLLLAVLPAPILMAAEDARTLVKMPPEARAEMRAEMLDFQAALHTIVAALGEGRHVEAASVAESMIGVPAMGRHRQAQPNARPGMYMPTDMHAIARGMHGAGSDFARVARTGDVAKSLVALQSVTGACVACHRGYRVQ